MVYNDYIKTDTFHVQHFSVWSNFNKVQQNVPYLSANLCTLLSINLKYNGKSIIIRNAVAFVLLLAALLFSWASLGVVSFISLLRRFEVARSVPLSQL